MQKKDVCTTRKQRRDISMFLKTGSRQRKTQQENKREKQKTTKKNNLKQSSFFEKSICKKLKKEKNITIPNEKTVKKKTPGKHTKIKK